MSCLSCFHAVKRTTASSQRPPLSPLYVDVSMAGDRSGSMSSTQGGSQEGAVMYMKKQKEYNEIVNPKLGYFVEFTSFDDETYRLYYGEADDIGETNLVDISEGMSPCGSTLLYDTVIECLQRQMSRLENVYNNLNKTTRKLVDNCPWLIACTFAIMTDGMDNRSTLNTVGDCKDLLKIYKEKYAGKALFIGANQDAEITADNFGIDHDSSLQMGSDRRSSFNAASAIASAQMRAVSSGGSMSQSTPAFTQLERDTSMAVTLTYEYDSDIDEDYPALLPPPPPRLQRGGNCLRFSLS